MQNDERAMLRDSLRRLLLGNDPAKVPAALDEFGWPELLAAEPAEAVAALFEMQGETLTASPAVNAVMARPLLAGAPAALRKPVVGPVRPSTGTSADPAAGDAPEGGSHGAAGSGAAVSGTGRSVGDWTVVVPGPGAAAGGTASVYALTGGTPIGRCLVTTQQDGQPVLAVVDPVGGAGDPARPVGGIDPEAGLVSLDAATEARIEIVARGPAVSAAWEEAVAAGRRALAHELAGLTRAMLAMAVEHAKDRRQFGRPVGEFQAVKHRLADAKVALTAAEAASAEAWSDPGPLTALLAKLWAGRAARLTGKQAQQVLGGMGFTWEHPFHRYVRRTMVLDALLGSTRELQREIGRALVASGEVFRLAKL